jgi:hypothetical protein
VAAALTLLLLTILVQFFRVSYRISHEELERSSLEATVLTLGNELQRDLGEVSPAGVSLSSSGGDLNLHPVTLSDIGTVVYQNRFVLWHHESSGEELMRFQSEGVGGFPFDGTAIRFPEASLIGLWTTPEFQRSDRFQRIKVFKVTSGKGVSAPFVASPLQIDITAELDLASTRRSLNLQKFVHLRNSGV